MSDAYDIWLYPLQDWWRTVNEMSDFMSTGQMGNFIFRPVFCLPVYSYQASYAHNKYTIQVIISLDVPHVCMCFGNQSPGHQHACWTAVCS